MNIAIYTNGIFSTGCLPMVEGGFQVAQKDRQEDEQDGKEDKEDRVGGQEIVEDGRGGRGLDFEPT